MCRAQPGPELISGNAAILSSIPYVMFPRIWYHHRTERVSGLLSELLIGDATQKAWSRLAKCVQGNQTLLLLIHYPKMYQLRPRQ